MESKLIDILFGGLMWTLLDGMTEVCVWYGSKVDLLRIIQFGWIVHFFKIVMSTSNHYVL